MPCASSEADPEFRLFGSFVLLRFENAVRRNDNVSVDLQGARRNNPKLSDGEAVRRPTARVVPLLPEKRDANEKNAEEDQLHDGSIFQVREQRP
jgi:hypothetical protein